MYIFIYKLWKRDICLNAPQVRVSRGRFFEFQPRARQGFRAPLEARLDYVSFDSSKSHSRKGPRRISSSSCYPEGKMHCFV